MSIVVSFNSHPFSQSVRRDGTRPTTTNYYHIDCMTFPGRRVFSVKSKGDVRICFRFLYFIKRYLVITIKKVINECLTVLKTMKRCFKKAKLILSIADLICLNKRLAFVAILRFNMCFRNTQNKY